MKICRVCQIEKEDAQFGIIKRNRNGKESIKLNTCCKPCCNTRQREYLNKNPKIKENQRLNSIKYSHKNKGKARKRAKEWRKNNLSRRRESNRKWRENNKEKANESNRKYYHKNQKKIYAKKRIAFKNSPHLIAKERCAKRIRHALLSQGSRKQNKTNELLGCTSKELRFHLEKQFYPQELPNGIRIMTWNNYGFGWHIEHIIPCDAFDLTKKEEQLACFHFSNLQPMWKKDNLLKGNILPDGTTPKTAGKCGMKFVNPKPISGTSFCKNRMDGCLS